MTCSSTASQFPLMRTPSPPCMSTAGGGTTGAPTGTNISTGRLPRTAGRSGGNVSGWRRKTSSRSSPSASRRPEAEGEGYLAGFAHTCLDADLQWGALLDNLHVRYDLKRQGVGRALMAKSAAALLERRPASRLYLYVLQQNAAAQGFYAALGGVVVAEEPARPIAGGGTAPVYRVAWRDPRLLLRGQG